uniref:Cytochrome c oxidase subunit 3 n=1 Tax=Hylaeus dilatatus TaxID=1542591 RepID=A0A0S2LTJ6_9HYME|nr:cytochrome c oxidase subunit III [Hylaeus dilatatus]AJG02943.1 cytochrome c oxidase subunit III [Hylaeus dilatatus]ALO64647.1 cytochrome c oxidase subunit III [Hylaeus dilatatus]
MSMKKNHPFHLVNPSPWPLILSINLMNILFSMLNWFSMNIKFMIILNLLILTISMYQWWRDIIRESTFQGYHTLYVYKLMKMGMILFIISEFFFFISFFWTYFHSAISPNIEIGSIWPPKMINMFNPYDIPLLNSIILISSGLTITWSHHSLINNKMYNCLYGLWLSITLGSYFTYIQLIEYSEAKFCFNDSIFGSIFFMMTGFHGLHVIIGIIFMFTCYYRIFYGYISKMHHFHFEAASWYWHFVDIIWLFLYISLYWWMFN